MTKYKKIIIPLIFITTMVVVSGCAKKQISNSQPAATSSAEQNATTSEEIYTNNNYQFQIKYPKNWYLYDCSDRSYFGISPSLYVHISDNQKDDCNEKGGKVNIIISNKDNFYDYTEYKDLKINNFKIGEIIARDISGLSIGKDPEGNIFSPEKYLFVRLFIVPVLNKYIIISYGRLPDENSRPVYEYITYENQDDIYYAIVNSFKFIK
ncbi:MAG: PsbP-related protein [Patescibacteria group bacterium]|nr:PsbP-related protein [Patescibacteria group bacterium]MDD4611211.1 PsbP-related protein [Patescibacteria group bacterium]